VKAIKHRQKLSCRVIPPGDARAAQQAVRQFIGTWTAIAVAHLRHETQALPQSIKEDITQ
jgi:hypothetical protein